MQNINHIIYLYLTLFYLKLLFFRSVLQNKNYTELIEVLSTKTFLS